MTAELFQMNTGKQMTRRTGFGRVEGERKLQTCQIQEEGISFIYSLKNEDMTYLIDALREREICRPAKYKRREFH